MYGLIVVYLTSEVKVNFYVQESENVAVIARNRKTALNEHVRNNILSTAIQYYSK